MENIGQKIFSQAMELWISPEIEKRRKANRLPTNFKLRGAQVIFSKDRGINKVRLNNEIKAVGKVKINRDIIKGEKIYEHDVIEIGKSELTDRDPNVAHITMVLFKNNWIISFDFRYNKKRVKDRLEASKEFYDSSKENLEKGRLRPFFENSFACAELLIEALLIQSFDKDSFKDHRSRLDKLDTWTKLGNINQKFFDKLKRLGKLRSSARYMRSTEFKSENPTDYLNSLKELYDLVEKSIK